MTIFDLRAVRVDLESWRDRTPRWIIARDDDVPVGWTIVSRHGTYVGLVDAQFEANMAKEPFE